MNKELEEKSMRPCIVCFHWGGMCANPVYSGLRSRCKLNLFTMRDGGSCGRDPSGGNMTVRCNQNTTFEEWERRWEIKE